MIFLVVDVWFLVIGISLSPLVHERLAMGCYSILSLA